MLIVINNQQLSKPQFASRLNIDNSLAEVKHNMDLNIFLILKMPTFVLIPGNCH